MSPIHARGPAKRDRRRSRFLKQTMSEKPLSDDILVSDLGEQLLLQRLQQFCPAELMGDDAAVLTPRPGYKLVITADMLVDGVHFATGAATPGKITTSLKDVGWRGAAANLSDLAAMGAQPLGITVSLGLPPKTPVRWLDELYEGMVDCLNIYQSPILGGDLCRSPVLTLAITALGEVLPDRQILRSTAQVGDAIVATGRHGASRAGLELLLDPQWGQDLSLPVQNTLKQAHQRPIPRLDVPPTLTQIDSTVRVAGMDSSDGLADAVLQICRASGVGAVLWRDRLPIPDALSHTQFLTEQELFNWVLYGGEDFELVLCLPLTIAGMLVLKLGPQASIIGRIVADPTVILADDSGRPLGAPLSLDQGFQHFS
jgi:thiamine-monophosphate kinase